MAAEPIKQVKDELGRKLDVQQLELLKELDLIEAAGPLAENSRWMQMARVAAMVVGIDGVPVPFPTNKAKIRQHIGKVGPEGMIAATQAFAPPDDSEDEEAAVMADAASLDTAKNLAGTPVSE